jgi:hypothetical protein
MATFSRVCTPTRRARAGQPVTSLTSKGLCSQESSFDIDFDVGCLMPARILFRICSKDFARYQRRLACSEITPDRLPS